MINFSYQQKEVLYKIWPEQQCILGPSDLFYIFINYYWIPDKWESLNSDIF